MDSILGSSTFGIFLVGALATAFFLVFVTSSVMIKKALSVSANNNGHGFRSLETSTTFFGFLFGDFGFLRLTGFLLEFDRIIVVVVGFHFGGPSLVRLAWFLLIFDKDYDILLVY